MRIPTLLEKINALAAYPEKCGALELDLMLDYTRVLYADLLEWRGRIIATAVPTAPVSAQEMIPEVEQMQAAPGPEETHAPMPTPMVELHPMSMPFQAAHPAETPDIRSLIGINDKYQIMSELFGNDKAAYEDALNHINGCGSEQEALEWLREQLWIAEERSDAALSFFDLVTQHFHR